MQRAYLFMLGITIPKEYPDDANSDDILAELNKLVLVRLGYATGFIFSPKKEVKESG